MRYIDCASIREARSVIEREMEEHGIVAGTPMYAESVNAIEGIDDALRALCENESTDCVRVSAARDLLGSEVRKYALFIKLSGKRDYYDSLVEALDAASIECSASSLDGQ